MDMPDESTTPNLSSREKSMKEERKKAGVRPQPTPTPKSKLQLNKLAQRTVQPERAKSINVHRFSKENPGDSKTVAMTFAQYMKNYIQTNSSANKPPNLTAGYRLKK